MPARRSCESPDLSNRLLSSSADVHHPSFKVILVMLVAEEKKYESQKSISVTVILLVT